VQEPLAHPAAVEMAVQQRVLAYGRRRRRARRSNNRRRAVRAARQLVVQHLTGCTTTGGRATAGQLPFFSALSK